MTQYSNLPLTAGCEESDRGNGATIHDTSHVAARHTTAAASRGERRSPQLAALAALSTALRI